MRPSVTPQKRQIPQHNQYYAFTRSCRVDGCAVKAECCTLPLKVIPDRCRPRSSSPIHEATAAHNRSSWQRNLSLPSATGNHLGIDKLTRIASKWSSVGQCHAAAVVDMGSIAQASPQVLDELCSRYKLEMDPSSVPKLIERFGVHFPGEPIL